MQLMTMNPMRNFMDGWLSGGPLKSINPWDLKPDGSDCDFYLLQLKT